MKNAGKTSKRTWRLLSETTGKTAVERLEIADGFWSRLVGLQFRRSLAADSGLLMVPCNSIHTCFVRFPLDIVFLDRNGVVLAVRRNRRPWRLTFGPRKSHAVLELNAGTAIMQPGETLRLASVAGSSSNPPKRASFLQK